MPRSCSFLLVCILQGFLNVIVYVYTNPDMKMWIFMVLTCQKPWKSAGSPPTDAHHENNSYDVEAVVARSPMFNTVNTNLSRDEMMSRDSFTEGTTGANGNAADSKGAQQGQQQAQAQAQLQTKGILQTNKPAKSWQVANLDQEKFVRFGE